MRNCTLIEAKYAYLPRMEVRQMDEKLNKDNLLRERVEEQVEKDKDNKKYLILLYKKGAMCIIALIIIILAAIAWFTSLQDVGTSGMGVTTATLPFDIATKGE